MSPAGPDLELVAPPAALSAGRLIELSVRDLALIERVRVELEPGLNVLTGETGAGKSLLIDALGLVLGGRADPGSSAMARPGRGWRRSSTPSRSRGSPCAS